MTFGFDLFNEFGERAVDYFKQYQVEDTKTCILENNTNFFPKNNGNYLISPTRRMPWLGLTANRKNVYSSSFVAQYATTGSNLARTNPVNYQPIPIKGHDSVVFFEMPSSGFIQCSSLLIHPADNKQESEAGMIPCIVPKSGSESPLKYKILRPGIVYDGPEEYGVKVVDEAGDSVFDSRNESLAIADFLFIDADDVFDVIENDTVKTYPLRQAVNDPYVNIPLMHCYIGRQADEWQLRLPWIRQTGPAELTMSRITQPGSVGGSTSAVTNYFHDIIILVADAAPVDPST